MVNLNVFCFITGICICHVNLVCKHLHGKNLNLRLHLKQQIEIQAAIPHIPFQRGVHVPPIIIFSSTAAHQPSPGPLMEVQGSLARWELSRALDWPVQLEAQTWRYPTWRRCGYVNHCGHWHACSWTWSKCRRLETAAGMVKPWPPLLLVLFVRAIGLEMRRYLLKALQTGYM